MIRAQAIDHSGSGKKRRWNPQKERYMEFTCARGITRYEDSDLNMSPEGKMRRQLMNQHDSELITIKAA
jgi:glucose dehydrogenase